MVSSEPTSHAGVYETTPNPYYPLSSFMAPGSQHPPGSINLENQAQGAQSAQPYFIISPGTSVVSQLGQRNTQKINPSVGTAVINFKEEAKALGVIQIMVGLMHLGFGIILCLIVFPYGRVYRFASTAVISGYPFWGGLSFIISGSLTVSASKELSSCLLSGKGISAMLIIFSLLEVCTACATAYFANQANTTINMPVLVIPNMYENNPVTPASSSAPPRCNNYFN
ncbi:membrane-spanning 4-domains subfamily A member 12-like isoform X4 [Trachypithecus francoisi]|uniref:membrane-spanning 4-domains subfamily A member 12-like isoform X4 n=1 Tax=Trachypithecus francoisi TaxID=54180 RepID=UPI00141B080B|nr:membrane-spanning 4-domains subfamily A member 12-like isoform X4 [Trachypithecus francoisi]